LLGLKDYKRCGDNDPHEGHKWTWGITKKWCAGRQKRCATDGCSAPISLVEDFCSEVCWEEWHAKYEPEVLKRVTPR
jgi:hypothetical protein